VTYRDAATVPTCAACKGRLEQAQTYFDLEGNTVCARCHKLGALAAAQTRATEDARQDAMRTDRAFRLARPIIAVVVLAIVYLISAIHRC
jgi:hypothetical protein